MMTPPSPLRSLFRSSAPVEPTVLRPALVTEARGDRYSAVGARRPARSQNPALGAHALMPPQLRLMGGDVHKVLEGVNTTPENVDEALEALTAVSSRLRERGDPRAVFPDVYGIITRNVRDVIEGHGVVTFEEPEWIARLAGRFGQLYFDALIPSLNGNTVRSRAWKHGFACGAQGMTSPVLDAVLGINAHINFDLAQGIADNIMFSGSPEKLARYKHDHDIVNEILMASMPEIYSTLKERYACRTTGLATASDLVEDGITGLILEVLGEWREDAWTNALAIVNAPNDKAYEEVIERMNTKSARISGLLGLTYRATTERLPTSIKSRLEHLADQLILATSDSG